MALWEKPNTPNSPSTSSIDVFSSSGVPRPPAPAPIANQFETSKPIPKERSDMKESVIAAGLSIEGKIVGSGHVRVAGKFKGDVQVDGNLQIDNGARVEGQVRANEILISGDLQGNVEGAKRVELQQGGSITGDVKAGAVTVAPGAKMRGTVEFGWEEGAKPSAALTDKSRINAA
jgi:cytoskeletal protein CcmA (bactofilin family)